MSKAVKTKSDSRQILFRASDDVKAAVQAAAEADNRSESSFVRLIVIDYLKQHGFLTETLQRPRARPARNGKANHTTSDT